jgi:CTP:phosphocholine cytidylyltransferase-like protein
MNIIILGDKYKKGMKSKGCAGLISCKNNKTIISNQYSVLKQKFPKSNIVYICGFESKRFNSFIKKNNLNITVINNNQYETTNNAHSLFLGKDFLYDNVLILCGYEELNKSILSNFNIKNGSQLFINNSKKSDLGCVVQDSFVNNISPAMKNFIQDIYYLSSDHAVKLKKILSKKNYSNYFIFELINCLIELGAKIYPYTVK